MDFLRKIFDSIFGSLKKEQSEEEQDNNKYPILQFPTDRMIRKKDFLSYLK